MALLNNPKGQVVTVPVTPNMALEFGFDPGSEAQLSRDGDNLIFTFEDGGQIVLTDFYTQEIEQLPTMDIQGAQISAEDFLASLGDDTLLPAAGPTAPQAPASPDSSGTGAYGDDAGNLIGGIDYLGMLGRIFWSQPSGNPLTEEGIELPGGDIGFDVNTDNPDGAGFMAAGAFEDGMPFQNEGIHSLHAGHITFNFSPTGTTTVTGVGLSGFDPGTRLYIGDPAQGGQEVIADANGVFHFTHANFTGPGVYFIPPENSDHDMVLQAVINLTTAAGRTATATTSFLAIVDAVADQPFDHQGEAAVEELQGGAEHALGEPPVTSGEASSVVVRMEATFTDVKDGSEHHYFEVNGIPADWTLSEIPAGWQLQVMVNGAWQNVTIDEWNSLAHDPSTVLRFDVTRAAIDQQLAVGGDDEAAIQGAVRFNPHDWTSSGTGLDAEGNPVTDGSEGVGRNNDGSFNSDPASINIYAVAEDQPGDQELNTANNTSRVQVGEAVIDIREDTPDFTGETIRIISDETRRVQDGTDEIGLRHISGAVKDRLAEIDDLPHSKPLSAAEGAIAYNLHSDAPGDAGGDLGLSFLGFEGTDGTSSGWFTTGGQEIFLYYQDGMAIGRIADANGLADPAGKIAFVAVATGSMHGGDETGSVTFIQYSSLHHPIEGSSSNKPGYNEEMGSDLGLKLVLIDDDGDKTSLDVNINVLDDKPSINCVTPPIPLDETWLNLPHGVLVAGGVIDYDFGRDTDGAKVEWDAANLPQLSCGGQAVQYDTSDPHQVRGFIIGEDGKEHTVLTMTFTDKDNDGHAHYVYKQYLAVDHPDTSDHDEPLHFSFNLKVTDGDGDVVEQAIKFKVDDDGPYPGLFIPTHVVFEDTLRGESHMMQANGKLSYDFGADNHAGTDIFWDKSVLANTFADVQATFGPNTAAVEVRYPADDTGNSNPNQPHYAEIWTKDPVTGADVKVADMRIFQDADGNYKYEYNQYHAIEHGSDILTTHIKELNLGYTIMDSDGDTAHNVVAMHVMDSVTIPRVDNYVRFDETDMNKDFSGVEGTNIPLKLDYGTPDGIKDVTWDAKGINEYLEAYNKKMLPSEADGFRAELADATGHVLNIYQHAVNGAGGVLVAKVTLVLQPDGTYSAVYDQVHQIDHPLGHQAGGIFHDDSVFFALPLHVTDGDNDTTHSMLTIEVKDDGPLPAFASNVLALESIATAVAEGMKELNFESAEQFMQSISKILGESLLQGLADTKSLADLADLVLNTNTMGIFDGTIWSGKVTDSDRSEQAGQVYKGAVTVDFGNDGPADPSDHNSYNMNPVGWSAAGVEGLLNLMGIHQTGHGDASLVVVGEGGNPPTTLQVYSSDDPGHTSPVMTLTIIGSGAGPYSYEITQHLPLGHNAGVMDGLLKALIGDGSNLPEALQGMNVADILTALGGGNMLALPLPIVITDNDGDSALGMVTVAIRDSVPVAPAAATAYVGESDLYDGRDAAHGAENVSQNPAADESAYKGTITVNYGFDGAHKDSPFEWNKPADGVYKTSDGRPISWGYENGDHTKLVGYAPDGTKVALIEVTNFTNNYDVSNPANPNYTGTVEYKVTLLESLQHETPTSGADENTLNLNIGFTVRDGDGDTKDSTLTVVVKDDIPQGYDEWDNYTWTGDDNASGNVLSGVSTWADAAFSKTTIAAGHQDVYGADGRAAAGGLKIVEPDLTTPDIHDGTAKTVELGDTVTVQGQYGTLTFHGDGSYEYEVDPVKYAAGQPTKLVTQFTSNTVDLADGPASSPDVTFTAFKNVGGYMSGWTPKTDPLPTGGQLNTLEGIKGYIATHGATAVDAGDGVGVKGNSAGINTGDGDKVGMSGTAFPPAITAEGLLIDLHNLKDGAGNEQFGAGPVSIKFGDLSNLESVAIYLYDAAGNLISNPLGGDSFMQLGAAGDTFTYNGATPVAHMVVIPLVGNFTVNSVTFPKGSQVEVPDPDAPYAPKETFDYILTDADGDSVTQTLTIDLKAPMILTLTGDKLVSESKVHGEQEGADGAPIHAHGTAVYSLELHDWINPDNLTSPVNITSDVTAGIKVTLGTAEYADLQIGSQGIHYTYVDANGDAKEGWVQPNLNGLNGTPPSFTFSVTIPAGAQESSLKFELPIADDSYSGKSFTGALDEMKEGYTVEVTGVTGSNVVLPENINDTKYPDQAGLPTSVDSTILDDGTAWNGTDWAYGSNKLQDNFGAGIDPAHPLDGPVVGLTLTPPSGGFKEGSTTGLLQITLKQFAPGEDPAAGGDGIGGAWNNGGKALDEPMVITFKIDDSGIKTYGADGNLTNAHITLAKASGWPADAVLSGPDSNGNYSVSLPKGFDASKLANLKLSLSIPDDEVVELTSQSFSAEITGSTGHESLWDGTKSSGTVADGKTTYLQLTGDTSVNEGATAAFHLQLATNLAGNALLPETKVAGPLDITLSFTPTDVHRVTGGHIADGADAGADYLTAALANPGNSADKWDALHDALFGNAATGITITSFTYSADTGKFSIEIHVEKGAWAATSGSNADILINVPTVKDEMAGEPVERFTVKIESYSQDAGDQEVVGYTTGGQDAWADIKDAVLNLGINGDTVVYEELKYGLHNDPKGTAGDPTDPWNLSGDNSYTMATYHVEWGYANLPAGKTAIANGDFSFNVSLQDGSAKFAANGADAPIDGSADYSWTDANGNFYDLSSVDGKAALLAAINLELNGADSKSGIYKGQLMATGISADGRTITFAVKEGCELNAAGLPVHVGAIDDTQNDSGQTYSLRLGGLTNDPDDILVKITDNQADTKILDGQNTGYGSGVWLKIEDAQVFESTTKDGATFDKDAARPATDLVLRIHAYEPGDPASSDPRADYKGISADGASLIPPATENITLNFKYNDVTTTKDADYYSDVNSTTIKPGAWSVYDENGNELYANQGGNVWGLTSYATGQGIDVADIITLLNGGQAHWEAKAVISGLIADDSKTELDEAFEIEVTSVVGNESYVHDDDKTSAVTIIEDSDVIPADGTAVVGDHHYLDGPSLESFTMTGKHWEPKATTTDGDDPANHDPADVPATSTATYTLTFDTIASQDIIIALDYKAAGAEFGHDFTNGAGLYTWDQLVQHYGGADKVPFYAEGMDHTKLYVIVPEGQSQASFKLNILHDHDSASKAGGLDSGAESISWTISDMTGSEVQWDSDWTAAEAAAYYGDKINSGEAPFIDDMKGPVVKLDFTSLDADHANGTLSGKLYIADPVKMGEDVTVKLEILDSKGNSFFVDVPGSFLANGSDGGELDFTDLTLPAGIVGYYHVRVASTDGGETQHQYNFSQPLIPGGGGGNGPLVIDVHANDIYEGGMNDGSGPGPKSVTYDLTVSNVSDHVDGDPSFTIRAFNVTTDNPDFDPENPSGGDNDVTVTLSDALLDAIRDLGFDSFELSITPADELGTPQITGIVVDGQTWTVDPATGNVTPPSGVILPGGAASIPGGVVVAPDGHLPTAYDDTIIEGKEGFTPLVIDNGGVIPAGHEPDTANIIDNDNPVVTVSFGYGAGDDYTMLGAGAEVTEGQMAHPSGEQYTVRVALSDGTNALTLDPDADPVTIVLTIKSISTGDNTTGTGDVNIYTTEVTLYPGDSLADVRVTFPDDFISDPDKQFTVEAAFKNPADAASFGGTGQTATIGYAGALADPDGVTINDLVDGPHVVALNVDHASTGATAWEYGENKTVDFVAKLDRVVAEDADLTLRLTFDSLAQGVSGKDPISGTSLFTPEDVTSLIVDGKVYNVTYDSAGSSWKLVAADGVSPDLPISIGVDGKSWEFKAPVHEGTAAARVSVVLNDDLLTETTEHFNLKVVGVSDAGELRFDPNDAALSKTIDVTDVPQGPQVYLDTSAAPGSTEGLTANMAIGGLPSSGVKVGFDVDMTVKDMSVLANGSGTLTYTDASGSHSANFTIAADGTFSVHVPAGATSAKLTFNLADNASSGANNPLVVSLDQVDGGEASIAGAPSFSSSFVEETYNTMTYNLTSDSALKSAGTVIYTLGGTGLSKSDISSVTIGGTTYSGASIKTNADGQAYIEVPHNAGGVADKLVVTFSGTSTLADKANLNISAGVSSEARITIADDSATHRDGPTFTVAAVSVDNAVSEGETVEFKIQPGTPNITTAGDNISLTFTLSNVPAGSAVTVGGATVGGPAVNGVSVALSGSTYTVTIAKGTTLADLAVKVTPTADNAIGVEKNVGITLGTATNGESAVGTTKTASVKVDEASNAVLKITQGTADVTEGNNLSFTLALANAVGGAAMTATEALTVTFLVSGLSATDVAAATIGGTGADLTHSTTNMAWSDNGNGTWNVTATLPAGSSSATLNIPVVNDHTMEGNEGVRIQVTGCNFGNLDDNIDLAAANPVGTHLDYTLHDSGTIPDYSGVHDLAGNAINLDPMGMEIVDLGNLHSYNGTNAGHGLVINGTGTADTIIGSGHSDIIYGGGGNDSLTGGLGDDIFVWKDGDAGTIGTPAVDKITDFSMGNLAGKGDDHLDLRDLISNADKDNLDHYLSITKSGDSAELHIHTDGNPNSAPTQVIVLENVYATHSDNGNNDTSAVDELIKQHIILNS